MLGEQSSAVVAAEEALRAMPAEIPSDPEAKARRQIRLTTHVIERFHERVATLDAETLKRKVSIEIHHGLDEGRYSTRKPTWAWKKSGREPGRGRGRLRFVWPVHRQYAYLVRMYRDQIVVITVLDGLVGQHNPPVPQAA
jgi:hypothetical protein